MLFWILLITIGILFLKGSFKLALAILLGFVFLDLIIGTVFWLLSPHVLIPVLIIAGVIWLLRESSQKQKHY